MPAGGPNQNVTLTGSLNTTTTTADQVILTYTVTAAKTLWLEFMEANVKLTTYAATATDFGTLSLRVNGVKKQTFVCAGPQGTLNTPVFIQSSTGLPYQAGDVITVVCTPTAVTPMTWEANLVGYEIP